MIEVSLDDGRLVGLTECNYHYRGIEESASTHWYWLRLGWIE